MYFLRCARVNTMRMHVGTYPHAYIPQRIRKPEIPLARGETPPKKRTETLADDDDRCAMTE